MSVRALRKPYHSIATLLLVTGLVACGGDDRKPDIAAVVAFGDSVSDVGTYAPATVSGGGKFTINPGPIWVENIAARYQLTVTPNIVGYGANTSAYLRCPAPSCTGYAQGGARVTDPNGVGKTEGALTLPIRDQIQNHLAANAGRFGSNELVLVFAGSNDVFVQLSEYGRLAAQQGPDIALATVQDAMTAAANELVSYVRNEIIARGAEQVVVVNLPSISQTPFGQKELDANGRQVADVLVNTFNSLLERGIGTDQDDILFFSANQSFSAIYSAPAASGFINNQDAACDPAKIAVLTLGQVTTGSSLFCNRSTLTSGAEADDRYQFADRVHPTPRTHQVFSDAVIQALQDKGWL